MIRYLIGIDFGHGETTASCVDLQSPDTTPWHLNILDGSTDEARKVSSCVWHDADSDQWFLGNPAMDGARDFFVNFKAPMNEISTDDKVAFGAFIRLVFEHILENQAALFEYNPQTGERNFEIYIACPSGWNKEDPTQIHQYLQFFKTIIPATWVLRESDAAYFNFKDQQQTGTDKVLVIDVGSSTIDFTSYDEHGMNQTEGFKHGASRVERDILRFVEQHYPEYIEARDELDAAFDNEHNKKRNWRNYVLHEIKKSKEEFYTSELSTMVLDLSNRRFLPTSRKRLFDNITFERGQLEEQVLAQYCATLRQDFENVAARTAPQTVILTGGASRMPWLQLLVKDVFSGARVLRDHNPSYVVSDGIAAYASAKHQYLQCLTDLVDRFWKEHSDAKFSDLLFQGFNDSLREIQLPMIKEICEAYRRGEMKDDCGNCSTQTFIPAMERHNNSVLRDNSGRISKEIDSRLASHLYGILAGQIRELFQGCYGNHEVTIPFNIDLHVELSDISIDNQWDTQAIQEITESLFGDWLNYGRIDKHRNAEDREIFSKRFYEKQQTADVALPPKMISELVEKLRNQIQQALDEVCMKAPFQTFE